MSGFDGERKLGAVGNWPEALWPIIYEYPQFTALLGPTEQAELCEVVKKLENEIASLRRYLDLAATAAALQQSSAEPVAWRYRRLDGNTGNAWMYSSGKPVANYHERQPLYAAPPALAAAVSAAVERCAKVCRDLSDAVEVSCGWDEGEKMRQCLCARPAGL